MDGLGGIRSQALELTKKVFTLRLAGERAEGDDVKAAHWKLDEKSAVRCADALDAGPLGQGLVGAGFLQNAFVGQRELVDAEHPMRFAHYQHSANQIEGEREDEGADCSACRGNRQDGDIDPTAGKAAQDDEYSPDHESPDEPCLA